MVILKSSDCIFLKESYVLNKSIKFSLDNDRHVIISGNDGTGKTQLALWFAEWFGKEKKLKNQIFFIVYA